MQLKSITPLLFSSESKQREKNKFSQKAFTKFDSSLKNNSFSPTFSGITSASLTVKNYAKLRAKVASVLDEAMMEDIDGVIKNASNIFVKNDEIIFQETPVIKQVVEHVLYPIKKMPFDVVDFFLNIANKVPGVNKVSKKIWDVKFLSNHRQKELDKQDFYQVMGLFEQLNAKVKEKGIDKVDDWIIHRAQSGLDINRGKYNTVDERALNRIVTGFIPSFFLANDAYNLSRYCDDDPTLADKEHKIRFRQEVTRVGITAYLTFITLGAMSKFVNRHFFGSVFASSVPVIVGEVTSRLINGKSLIFLNKKTANEKLQKQEEKQSKLSNIDIEKAHQKAKEKFNYYDISSTTLNKDTIFMQFSSIQDNNGNTIKNVETKVTGDIKSDKDDILLKQNEEILEQENAHKHKKQLFTVKNFGEAMLGALTIGYVLKFARKNEKVNSFIKNFLNFFSSRYYNKFQKDLIITEQEKNKIVKKLQDSGFQKLAAQYEKFINSKSKDGGTYNLGKVDKKSMLAANFVIAPFKFLWLTVYFPYRIVNNLVSGLLSIKNPKPKKVKPDNYTSGIKYVLEAMKKTNLSDEKFKRLLKQDIGYPFNNITRSSYSNGELASATKLFASTITSWFLIADDYNMVMLKSKGNDRKGAQIKAKERFVQRLSSIFYQVMFINLFNTTFQRAYHATLMGMAAVAGSCTIVCEVFSRMSIGKPVFKRNRDEILAYEKRNATAKGIKGSYFRFMRQLTGRKTLAEDIERVEKQRLAKA